MQVKLKLFSKMPASKAAATKSTARRSPCPVSCGLEIFGDRWTLLIIRDLFFGRTRFKEFLASPEGIPTNILADRLKRLATRRLVRRISDAAGSRHLAYQLTEKGQALLPILRAMKEWGLQWEKGTRANLSA
jgi:DNA-binding HxlR family transcriptional regulator